MWLRMWELMYGNCKSDSGTGNQDLGFGNWYSGFGIRDLGFGIWDLGFGIRDLAICRKLVSGTRICEILANTIQASEVWEFTRNNLYCDILIFVKYFHAGSHTN